MLQLLTIGCGDVDTLAPFIGDIYLDRLVTQNEHINFSNETCRRASHAFRCTIRFVRSVLAICALETA